jgi:hypothetical protein
MAAQEARIVSKRRNFDHSGLLTYLEGLAGHQIGMHSCCFVCRFPTDIIDGLVSVGDAILLLYQSHLKSGTSSIRIFHFLERDGEK